MMVMVHLLLLNQRSVLEAQIQSQQQLQLKLHFKHQQQILFWVQLSMFLLGGQASGETQVVVVTNDHLGYSMTVTASSSLGMIGNASSTLYIPAYVTSAPGTPDFTFSVPANTAYYGYTVEASTTSDLVTAFKDNSTVCGVAGSDTADKC